MAPVFLATLAFSPSALAAQEVPASVRMAFESGDYAEALPELQAAEARCASADPSRRSCLQLITFLAAARGDTDDPDEQEAAIAWLEAAAEAIDDPDGQLVLAMLGLGNILQERLALPAAAQALRKGLALVENAPDRFEPYVRDELLTEGYTLLLANLTLRGLAREAEPIVRDMLAFQQANAPDDVEEMAALHVTLGTNLTLQGRFEEARTSLETAMGLLGRIENVWVPTAVIARIGLARCLLEAGELEPAEALLREAIGMQEDRFGPDRPSSEALLLLAKTLDRTGRPGEAAEYHDRALAAIEGPDRHRFSLEVVSLRSPPSEFYLASAINLAGTGREALAEERFLTAIAAARSTLFEAPISQIRTRAFFADFLMDDPARRAAARTMYRAARRALLGELDSYGTFDRAAQQWVRLYRGVFTGEVRAAWELSSSSKELD